MSVNKPENDHNISINSEIWTLLFDLDFVYPSGTPVIPYTHYFFIIFDIFDETSFLKNYTHTSKVLYGKSMLFFGSTDENIVNRHPEFFGNSIDGLWAEFFLTHN